MVKLRGGDVTTAVAEEVTQAVAEVSKTVEAAQESVVQLHQIFSSSEKFLPLVKNIASAEGVLLTN
jgi:2-oxoglutarate dehydrogenase E2 component (dihydrolipoamide succinyltransferase)